jgi:hypothetical protein
MTDPPLLGVLQPETRQPETGLPLNPTGRGESDSWSDSGGRDSGGGATRYSRRLSDKILIAFHHACDQADYQIAEQLLHVLEGLLKRRPIDPDTNRRRSMENLVAAYERLWLLRHQRDPAN